MNAKPSDGMKEKASARIREKASTSMLIQVAALFFLGVLLTGVFTYLSQRAFSDVSVRKQTESLAAEIADEVDQSVREYPAYQWLIRYWYEHPDTLDIEYDAEYGPGTRTEEKSRILLDRHPGLFLKYAGAAEIEALPEEDQKLYAEIVYSWLITRVNQIKRSFGVDYLFSVITEEPFDRQFFLFSAADPDSVRGTNYEEVYPLGVTVTVSESQQKAMRDATEHSMHLANAGGYVDLYALLGWDGPRAVLIGLTYNRPQLAADIHKQTVSGTAAAVLGQILLSIICLMLIWFAVLRPLKDVQKSIRKYKEQRDSAAVRKSLSQVRSRNEIGQLAEDVADMTREIDGHVQRIEAITAEKERISTELHLASRIQSNTLPNLFPPFPERKEFDIYAVMDPAREIGGDLYDFFLVDDDHLALMIADVSGKGVPAALCMMVSLILVHNTALNIPGPAKILEVVNDQFCAHNPEEMFVSVWLGILEISTGKLTASNAGHEYPMLKMPGGAYELVKQRSGFVIGGMEGMKYKEYSLQLVPGAQLFLYTDGLPEATDAGEAMFGIPRALEVLNASGASRPKEIIGAMRTAVDGFVKDAEQFDDLTMVCLTYYGPEKNGG